MKTISFIALFLGFIVAGFGQFQPQFAPKDSAVLRKTPYFFKDPKRPYNKDPRTWTNYPTNIKNLEQAAAEIEKAKKENDFYRVFQIGTLGLFKEEKDRINAIYAPEYQAYIYQDPWMLLNVTNYLIEHPVTGYNDMKTSFVAELIYKAAMSQKDAEALYAIAELQKKASLINNVTVATILENAKKFEQKPSIAAEPKKSTPAKETPYVPKVGAKHMGKLISGNITNGKVQNSTSKKILWLELVGNTREPLKMDMSLDKDCFTMPPIS